MQKNSWHFGGDAPAKISSFGKEQSQFPAAIRPRKLLDHVRDVLRVNHYSLRTEEAYLGWIRRFILFNGKKHPGEMGASEVETYLTHLAVGEMASSSHRLAPGVFKIQGRKVRFGGSPKPTRESPIRRCSGQAVCSPERGIGVKSPLD